MVIEKVFKRDGRAPIPDRVATSNVMSANKAKNTKPEIIFRKMLWSEGITGYRLHWKKAPGRPDVAFPARKIAIFINGCFWHRCPNCRIHMPKSNTSFWREKFNRNVRRDKEKVRLLENDGWEVIIIWECEVRDNIIGCIDKTRIALNVRHKNI